MSRFTTDAEPELLLSLVFLGDKRVCQSCKGSSTATGRAVETVVKGKAKWKLSGPCRSSTLSLSQSVIYTNS